MAQYDGTIRIATKITTKDATESLASLEWQIKKSAKYMDELRSKMDALKDQKIPTEEYKKLEKELESAYSALNSLVEEQKKYKDMGFKEEDIPKKLTDEIDKAGLKVGELEEKVQKLNEEGRAFVLGQDTEQYAAMGRQLQYEEEAVRKAAEHYKTLLKTSDGYKKIGDTAKKSFDKINKSARKTNALLSQTGMGFKNILKYGLGIRSLYALFNKLRAAIKEGFSNLYNDANMTAFKNQVDSLKASMLTLKNSFASAFRPLVEMAIPYIQKTIEYMTKIIDLFGQFIAVERGQKTYTKAIKQTADAFKDAKKAADGYLSPLDEINKFNSKKDNSDENAAGTMFEEVPIDNKIFDWLQKIKDFLKPIIDYAKKLKDIFMQGFWDGLGNWEYRWESIKRNISSIKDSMIDIWTDSSVLSAANGWVQSVSYLIGSITGSAASVGLTIATNLIGGIDKYLKQNTGRIKDYLISMFEIRSEINSLFADLFQSIAYVFEAFANESGQQITANVIGIFADAFMGITELASKLFRDIAQIIINPFSDNKDAFRTAIEGFLGVLAQVTGTIKQGIEDTFNKLNEVYKEHLKPFFDSIASGLSDTVRKFMEFWNGNVRPILEEWAVKFDEIWKDHIQPMLSKFMELLGDVADFLKVVWENFLKPLIDWIIKNVLPVLLPVFDGIKKGFMEVAGTIADVVGGIIDVISGILKFLTGVFTGNWKKAWDGIVKIFSGVGNSIKGIVNGILGVIESLANGVINGINFVIGALNKLHFDIPEWVPALGGKSFGFSIPEIQNVSIPKLATGAVIPANKEFLAVLGDQKHGTNVEAPLDTIEEASERAILNVLSKIGMSGGNIGGTPVNLTLQVVLDRNVVGQTMIDWGKIQQMATGNNPYALGNT